jgi:hypothetical protein
LIFLLDRWSKPQPPNIKPVTDGKRGKVIGAFVLFAGCKPDSVGVCNSEVDYVVIKPDGNVYAERKGQPLWDEQAPPAQNIRRYACRTKFSPTGLSQHKQLVEINLSQ